MFKRKIVLFGGSGQVGQQLFKHLHPAYQIDAPKRATVDVQNEADVARYLQDSRPYAVINAAAYTAVDACEQQVNLAYAVNAQAAKYIATYAQEVGAKLVHLSTDYVFDGEATQPYDVDDICTPLNQYGQSKLDGEQAVLQVMPSAVIVRTAWLYSESGHNFLKTILKAALSGQALRVVDDQRGSPTYAGHLAEALYAILEQSLPGGVYHFAGDSVMSWHQFAQYVLDEACSLSNNYVPQRIITLDSSQLSQQARRPQYTALNTDRLLALGIEPSQFKQGVQQSLSHLIHSALKP